MHNTHTKARRLRHVGELRRADLPWWFDIWEPVRGHGLAITLHLDGEEDRTKFFRRADDVAPLFSMTSLEDVLGMFVEG